MWEEVKHVFAFFGVNSHYKKCYYITIIILACTKNRLGGKHVTGNPAPCTYFNDQDLAILRILGDTPSFRGVKKRPFDTPIVMSRKGPRNVQSNINACRAEVTGATAQLTKALNTGNDLL